MIIFWLADDYLDYPLNKWANALAGVLIGIAVWLPLILITYRPDELPIIPGIITLIAVWAAWSTRKDDYTTRD